MIKQFANEGNKDYCFMEVEQGKSYRIKINANENIVYQYVITDDKHTATCFCGPKIFKYRDFAKNIQHILKAEKTGHLCLRDWSLTGTWTKIIIEVEEIEDVK